MRIAALYDIHGNLPALEAVLAEVRAAGVDRIVVGGDVMPGPMPDESLARLLGLDVPVQCIHGNGEREILARRAGIETGAVPVPFREAMQWVAERLTPEHARIVATWPSTLRMQVDGLGAVLFCHATPRNDTEIFTRRTPDDVLRPIFDALDVDVVVCGHTHMPFDRTIGRVRVVNAGSVGMPFGAPGADWLLLGPGIEPRHTDYDLARAAERIRATAYPQAEEFAARNVLQPPSAEEILAVYARAEIGR